MTHVDEKKDEKIYTVSLQRYCSCISQTLYKSEFNLLIPVTRFNDYSVTTTVATQLPVEL